MIWPILLRTKSQTIFLCSSLEFYGFSKHFPNYINYCLQIFNPTIAPHKSIIHIRVCELFPTSANTRPHILWILVQSSPPHPLLHFLTMFLKVIQYSLFLLTKYKQKSFVEQFRRNSFVLIFTDWTIYWFLIED